MSLSAWGSVLAGGAARAGASRWLPAGLVLVAVWLAGAAAWDSSATNDEPYHILAAWVYVHDGHADLNPEHPPLTKLLAGLPLQLLDLRGPEGPPVERLPDLTAEVRRFLYFNRADSQTILHLARLPGLGWLALLLAGVFTWAQHAWGRQVGLLALVATAGAPLVLAHAPIVHTDVAAAATWVWTGLCLHRWLAGWRWGWPATGVALGLALAVKLSAVHLVLLVVAAVLLDAARRRTWAHLPRLAGAGIAAGLVMLAATFPAVRHVGAAEHAATVRAFLGQWRGTDGATRALESLGRWSVPAAQWGLGLAYVRFNNRTGQGVNFLCGETSVQGFPQYFPVALALKTSLPFLLAALWGAWRAGRRHDPLARSLLAVVGFYLLVSLGSSYNIGARHLLPVVPALAMVAAWGVADRPAWVRRVAAVALAASAAVAFPHYLAHFTLLVGGARGGRQCLNDSNLDWGQDWRRVGRLAQREGWQPMGYLYLGAGYPAADVPRAVDLMDAPPTFRPAYVAVSSFVDTVGVDYLAAFGRTHDAEMLGRVLTFLRRRGVPVATVGHSITVYRLP